MNVRRAKEDDVALVASMLDEATAYVATKGYDQWPAPFPEDELRERVARGELYVVDVDGEPAATFTLLFDDPSFWGTRPPDAVYLHKLAIRRSFAGRGLGTRILDWVEAEAVRAGRPLVRLDCMRDNPRIRAYYERLGFEYRGDIDHPRFAAALYERRIHA